MELSAAGTQSRHRLRLRFRVRLGLARIGLSGVSCDGAGYVRASSFVESKGRELEVMVERRMLTMLQVGIFGLLLRCFVISDKHDLCTWKLYMALSHNLDST